MTEYEKMIRMVDESRPQNIDDCGMYDRKVLKDNIHKLESMVYSGKLLPFMQESCEQKLYEFYEILDGMNIQSEKTRENSHVTKENYRIPIKTETPLDEALAIRAHQNHYDGNITHDRLNQVLYNLERGDNE